MDEAMKKRAEDDLLMFGSCVVMIMADGTARHVPLDEFTYPIRSSGVPSDASEPEGNDQG